MADVKPSNTLWVQSNDGANIEIERAVAERSMLIKNLIEDIGDTGITKDTPIPIPNVCTSASCLLPWPL